MHQGQEEEDPIDPETTAPCLAELPTVPVTVEVPPPLKGLINSETPAQFFPLLKEPSPAPCLAELPTVLATVEVPPPSIEVVPSEGWTATPIFSTDTIRERGFLLRTVESSEFPDDSDALLTAQMNSIVGYDVSKILDLAFNQTEIQTLLTAPITVNLPIRSDSTPLTETATEELVKTLRSYLPP